jgi:prepilin-type N-terminal cleavage/methylation domain-containing protein
MPDRPPADRGVTLVELLIVTTMLGAIAMLAYPGLVVQLEDSRLRSAAARVCAAIEAAQLRAVNSGRQTRVIFDAAADTVHLEHYIIPPAMTGTKEFVNESNIDTGSFGPMRDPLDPGKPYTLNLSHPLFFDGVDLAGADFGGVGTITFSTLGAPHDGGTVTLACGGRQTRISIAPLTGKATVIH